MPKRVRGLTILLRVGLLTGIALPVWAATLAAPELTQRLLQDMQQAISRVEPWLAQYGYGAVFVAVAVEGFGIPAPGQTLLIAGAVTAASQGGLHIELVLLTGFLAALIGNSLGYLLGRWGGRALLQRLRLSETLLQSLERGFSRYGGGLLVVARFFDGPRQLNGITAGILEMPGWRFSLYNALGALLWASVWSLGVYTVDTHLHAFLAILRQCNPWVAGLTLMAMALAAAALWRARR